MLNNKIIIIGGSVIETDQEYFYARSQIVEYLEGFKKYYSSVTWSVRLANTHNYRTTIESGKVDFDILNKNYESIFSLGGLARQFCHYIKFAWKLDKKTDVIVSSFSLTSIPYLIIVRIFGHKSLYYIGSDPRLTRKLRRGTLYGRFASLLNCLLLPLSLLLANGVLVRGKTTYEQCQRWNNKCHLSKPLISYKYFRGIKPQNMQKNLFEILYVGKLEENKGVQNLIKAISPLCNKDKYLPCRLTVVGSGAMEAELLDLVASYDITDKVHFCGFVDDAMELSTIFSASDLFVVPTVQHEGFPRVIDEAMACGLPVICSRLGGMKDGLSEDEVLFVEPGNYEELADAIKKLIGNKNYREKLQQASRARAELILHQTATEQHVSLLTQL